MVTFHTLPHAPHLSDTQVLFSGSSIALPSDLSS